MIMLKFIYSINNKKKTITAKVCKSIFSQSLGLMFKKTSPPLLFVFPKEQKISIHSFFCKPFQAIWINNKLQATKIVNISKPHFSISGTGSYLLEIPIIKEEIKTSTETPPNPKYLQHNLNLICFN